jgi:hypothetical protein
MAPIRVRAGVRVRAYARVRACARGVRIIPSNQRKQGGVFED